MSLRALLLATAMTGVLVLHSPQSVPAAEASHAEMLKAANDAMQNGDSATAAEKFTKALDSNDLDVDTRAFTLLNRGLAYQRLGKYREAIEDYAAALRLDALSPRTRAIALYNRGLAHRKLEDTTAALEDFTNALLLDSRLSQAYHSRGNMMRDLGKFQLAIRDYERAIRYGYPHAHLALYGMALAHEALDEIDLAQKALTRALLINPEFGDAQRKLAELGGEGGTLVAGGEGRVTGQSGAGRITTGSLAGADQVINKSNRSFRIPAPELSRMMTAGADAQKVIAKPASDVPNALTTQRDMAAGDLRGAVGTGNSAAFVSAPADDSDATGAGTMQSDADEAAASETAATTPADDSNASDNPSTPTRMAALQPAEETAPQQARPAGYMVQLSAQRDRDAARAVWNKLAAAHGKLFNGLEPIIIEADLGNRGTFYRLRTGGFEKRSEAEKLCTRFKGARIDCYVVAPEG